LPRAAARTARRANGGGLGSGKLASKLKAGITSGMNTMNTITGFANDIGGAMGYPTSDNFFPTPKSFSAYD
jgi:hypothetical protein